MITEPIKVDINSSTWTAVTLGNDTAYGFAAYCVDSSFDIIPCYVSTTGSGVGFQIPAAGIMWDHIEEANSVLFYAKTTTGSGVCVVVPGNYNKA